MSFLFKSKKHQQPAALPAATREITSSHGPGSSIPVSNGLTGSRDPEKARGGPQTQTPTPGSSVNNSLNSLQAAGTASPEPKTLRDRSDSNLHNGRNARGPPTRAPTDTPYPWSQRRLNFSRDSNPFPRYGAAVNSNASKDGAIYLMGGLVNGSTVKGDLWMVEAGLGNMQCYPVPTGMDGPGPRVGHASLLVGNAFIVFGGDTKMDESDELDDTLYLLNTSTKQWSRALPAGPRPQGRYGHTLNILGSKIYIFGGQVDRHFFNDLVAFDLNALQASSNRWETLIPDSKVIRGQKPIAPPARTNHTIVTWNDRLYLFGGTDGETWFNDVWAYDARTNTWEELECIGYIPVAREGHAAAIVGDTMYIFGGRTEQGNDLGDLAAFKIPSRRWYMFQNMGPSPSPRSGHSMTAFGRHIIVLSGEPSSSAHDPNELSLAYVLDTSKIRYPAPSDGQGDQPAGGVRKLSNPERSGIPQGRVNGQQPRESFMGNGSFPRPGDNVQGSMVPATGSRLPRAAGAQASSGPPPQQQAPQPRANGVMAGTYNPHSRTPTKTERGFGASAETSRSGSIDRENMSPAPRDSPSLDATMQNHSQSPPNGERAAYQPPKPASYKESMDTSRSGPPSRTTSRSTRQQHSIDSTEHGTPRPSVEAPRTLSRETEHLPIDSGVGSSPALSQQNDELAKELEAAKGRNAWYASELALARKAGYQPNASNSPILDAQAADAFGDEDRPLLEALLKMKAELSRVQGSIDEQAHAAANKIAEVEKQRDAAVSEAVYAKAKLAAHGGFQQPEGGRGITPDEERVGEISQRLASSLATQKDLSSKIDGLTAEIEAEKRARHLAEETAEAFQKRAAELDSYRQRNAGEVESLRAELHETQRAAREEAANAAEALATQKLLAVDKNELHTKHTRLLEDTKNHTSILESLRNAVNTSTEKASLLERKLDEERGHRTDLEQKLAQLKSLHEGRTAELETAQRRLHDAEELAEKHAEEARTHREVVMNGLGRAVDRDDDEHEAADERVTILQQQVEAANLMVRRNQDAADNAAEKLRRAEERIAGLEQYQEQTSRESLSIRKQLQSAMREVQTLQAERSEMQQQFERHRLDANAVEVQLKSLKNILEERGINAVDHRRSRALDSPSSRFSTPELNRVRELEQQLDNSLKAHEELRSNFEQREYESNKEWAEKLAALDNDHQAAVKNISDAEKMLSKMMQELQRYKAANTDLRKELVSVQQKARSPTAEASAAWDRERESLREEISQMSTHLKSLETQLNSLQSELAAAQHDRDVAKQQVKELEAQAEQVRADLDNLRQENSVLEERVKDAEHRCQLFLDQFESSVDNYRRQSQATIPGTNGIHGHTRNHDSISGESLYSNADQTDGSATPDANEHTRNSLALDSLATELDALRSHWETTNKNYRLSDKFDFERTPTTPSGDLNESLSSWRKRMDLGDEDEQLTPRAADVDRKPSTGDVRTPTTPNGMPAVGPGGAAMI